MERIDWTKIKSNGQYTIEALYEFWNENKKPHYDELTLEEFSKKMGEYIRLGGEFSHQKINEFFDKKFNIVSVFDKNGKLLKQL